MAADGISSTNLNSFAESPLIKPQEQEKTYSAEKIDIYSDKAEKQLQEMAAKNPKLFGEVKDSPDLCMEKMTAFSDVELNDDEKKGVVEKLATRLANIQKRFAKPTETKQDETINATKSTEATGKTKTAENNGVPQVRINSSKLADNLEAKDIQTAMNFVSANGETIQSGKYQDSADFKNLSPEIQNYITAKFVEASAQAEN